MKGTSKYILLLIVACACSIFIYYLVGPTDEDHKIGIFSSEQISK
jgi:hypothetical protein